MAHIHTEDNQHDMTASAFIVRTDLEEPSLLLHMHKKLGMWMQPGGHIELDENPWQAVLHEIEEETGYELGQLMILQPSLRLKTLTGAVLHPQPVIHNTHDFNHQSTHKHTDVAYAFVANGSPTGKPHEGESTDFRWVNIDQLRALGHTEILRNVQETADFILTQVLSKWEPVELSSFQL